MLLRWVIIICGLSALIIASAFGIKYLRTSKKAVPVQNIVQTTPSPFPTSNISVKPTNLESCDVKKEDNPLLSDFYILKDGTKFGTFRGNVLKTSPGSSAGITNIELVSPKGEQKYTFEIKDRPKLIYNSSTLKNLTINDLKPMETLFISFSCDPKQDFQFKIERIAVTSN